MRVKVGLLVDKNFIPVVGVPCCRWMRILFLWWVYHGTNVAYASVLVHCAPPGNYDHFCITCIPVVHILVYSITI